MTHERNTAGPVLLLIIVIVIIVTALVLSACSSEPVKSGQADNNPNVTVDLLFQHDGVRVYRFHDGGRTHYYAVPIIGSGASTMSTYRTGGKNRSTHHEDITTTKPINVALDVER